MASPAGSLHSHRHSSGSSRSTSCGGAALSSRGLSFVFKTHPHPLHVRHQPLYGTPTAPVRHGSSHSDRITKSRTEKHVHFSVCNLLPPPPHTEEPSAAHRPQSAASTSARAGSDSALGGGGGARSKQWAKQHKIDKATARQSQAVSADTKIAYQQKGIVRSLSLQMVVIQRNRRNIVADRQFSAIARPKIAFLTAVTLIQACANGPLVTKHHVPQWRTNSRALGG